MAEKIDQQLSALMDGECGNAELALALRRLVKQTDLQARWQRYHLIGETLKKNLPDRLDTAFADRIRAAIELEPLPAKAQRSRPPWYKPAVGLAAAASVVAAVALGISLYRVGETPLQPLAGNTSATVQDVQETPQQRLNAYLVDHSELATMNNVHGILPYVSMVNHGGR